MDLRNSAIINGVILQNVKGQRGICKHCYVAVGWPWHLLGLHCDNFGAECTKVHTAHIVLAVDSYSCSDDANLLVYIRRIVRKHGL